MDFDFVFETDEDIMNIKELNEDDIYKMLGNKNETSIVNPFFNTTEIKEPVPLNNPQGKQHHDKKHHYKHHQKHPKNMIKHGFVWDLHKATASECIKKADMIIGCVMTFIGFWATIGIMFW
jgi:hypothetical protein